MAESDSNSATSASEDQQQNEESGIDELEVRCSSRCFIYTDEDEMDSDDKDDEIDSAFLR